MGPDPTQAYFWLAVNKRPTHLWPGYILTRLDDIFLSEGEKIEKLGIFRGNFTNPINQRWLTWPDPSRVTKIDPDPNQVKTFWQITKLFSSKNQSYFNQIKDITQYQLWKHFSKMTLQSLTIFSIKVLFSRSQLNSVDGYFLRRKIPNFCKHSSTPKPKPKPKTKTNYQSIYMKPRLRLGFPKKFVFYVTSLIAHII